MENFKDIDKRVWLENILYGKTDFSLKTCFSANCYKDLVSNYAKQYVSENLLYSVSSIKSYLEHNIKSDMKCLFHIKDDVYDLSQYLISQVEGLDRSKVDNRILMDFSVYLYVYVKDEIVKALESCGCYILDKTSDSILLTESFLVYKKETGNTKIMLDKEFFRNIGYTMIILFVVIVLSLMFCYYLSVT